MAKVSCLFVFILILLPCVFASDKFSKRLVDCIKEKDACTHNKFWVYFTDKGIHNYHSQDLQELTHSIKDSIHPNSIKRRTKHLTNNETFHLDEKDFPIYNPYITTITSINKVKLSKTSKWLNSISIITDIRNLQEIEKFSFVKKIDMVAQFKKIRNPITHHDKKEIKNNLFIREDGNLDYGESFDQLNAVSVPDLHALGLTGEGIIVLIADSGYNLDHPAIKDLDIFMQKDFINDDDDVTDQNSDEIGGLFLFSFYKVEVTFYQPKNSISRYRT